MTAAAQATYRCPGCGVDLTGSHPRRKWCSERCRKRQYVGACVDCGAPTDGSNGREHAPERCASCAARHQHEEAYWTTERIVEAIREFARRYGRQPSATDFNPSHARSCGFDERADVFYADGCYPFGETVRRLFGSWNAAISAAGFEPLAPGRPRGVPTARRTAAA